MRSPPSSTEDSPVTDADIIKRIRAADESGDEDLVRKYQRQLVILCSKGGLPPEDAEEVAATVLARAITRARAGTMGPNVGPWLRRVARNEAIDRHRADDTRRDHEARVIEVVAVDPPPFGRPTVHLRIVSSLVLIVRRALRNLDKREKERTGSRQSVSDVEYLMWIGHRATNEQLADWSGITEGNARVRRQRVLERLKEEISKILARLPKESQQRALRILRVDDKNLETLLQELLKQQL